MQAKLNHTVNIELADPAALQNVVAGSEITPGIRITCPFRCDLPTAMIEIDFGEHGIASHTLAELSAADGSIVICTPNAVGRLPWSVRFPEQEVGGQLHRRQQADFALTTVAIATTLAIWDIPRPVIAAERFHLRAGVKSSMNLPMAGANINVFDADGAKVCGGPVGGIPIESTVALYAANLEILAPPTAGYYEWTVKTDLSGIHRIHEESCARLGFVVVPIPEYLLRISLTDEQERDGIEKAVLRLGPYTQMTDVNGSAEFQVCSGEYRLQAWHPNYEMLATDVEVRQDTHRRFSIRPLPQTDNDVW